MVRLKELFEKVNFEKKKLWVDEENIFILFLNQNICCGYSKELSQWAGSLELP